MTDLIQWGAPGVCLAAVAIYYAVTQKNHREERERMEKAAREEREDFRQTIERQFQQSNEVQSNVTKAITELSTLIKNIRK